MSDIQTSVAPCAPFRLRNDIDGARHLKEDLNKLLTGVETVHLKRDVRTRIETLNDWVGQYYEGLEAARKLSETGLEMLKAAQEQITLALDEYMRLEDEGGQVATPEQTRLTEELNSALRRIHRVTNDMEGHFAETAPA